MADRTMTALRHPVRAVRDRRSAIGVATVFVILGAYLAKHFTGKEYEPTVLLAGVVIIWYLSRHPGPTLTVFLALFPFEQFILGFIFGLHAPHALVRDLGYWKEVVAAVVIVAAVRERQRRPRKLDALDIAGLVYVAVVLLYYLFPHFFAHADSFIPPPAVRQVAVRSDGLFVLMFLAARHARLGREWAEQTAKVILVVGAVIAAIGIYEFTSSSSWARIVTNDFHILAYRQAILGGNSTNNSTIVYHSTAGSRSIIRIGSVFLNPLILGAWLAIPLAIGVERLARGIGSVFTVVAVALVGSALVLTQTRSAVLSGVVVILLVTRPAPGRDLGKRIRFALLAGVLVILAIPLAVSSGFTDRAASATNGTDTSTTDHIKSFTDGVTAVEKAPLGRGLGTAPGVGVRFDITGTIASENYYLQVGDEIGIFAMVAFILVTILTLRRLRRAQRSGPGASLISAMRAAMFGLAVGAFLLHVWADINVAITAWTLAGASLGIGETIPLPPAADEPVRPRVLEAAAR